MQMEIKIMAKIKRYCGPYILEISGGKLKEYCGPYRYELQGDWSSDVCSSDLNVLVILGKAINIFVIVGVYKKQ